MTETHTHPNEYPHAENEAAPSAAQHTLGKNRFRFLHRERRGSVNWLALGFSAPWLVFLLIPPKNFPPPPGTPPPINTVFPSTLATPLPS